MPRRFALHNTKDERRDTLALIMHAATSNGMAAKVCDLIARPRDFTVTIDTGFHGLAANIWIWPADHILVSWHGVRDPWRLSPHAFQDVNRFHYHKATDIVHTPEQLAGLLGRRLALIAKGGAFQPLADAA